MTDFIVIHSNQKVSTLVSKKAFEDIVNTLPKVIDGIKVNTSKTNIEISSDNKKINIFLEVKISPEYDMSEKIKEIKNKIDTHSLYLIDSKPQNIMISYIGKI